MLVGVCVYVHACVRVCVCAYVWGGMCVCLPIQSNCEGPTEDPLSTKGLSAELVFHLLQSALPVSHKTEH